MAVTDYDIVIGLEVHMQLNTKSKLFCGCSTEFGNAGNTQTCEVCAGLPGALPVLNATALEYAVKAGYTLNCQIQEKSVFARKNYYYPDLPKGYQISQYDRPICLAGSMDIHTESGGTKKIGITRIHMEEDAGKSVHGFVGADESFSYVDLNRSSVPLLEIVTEPDMTNADEAKAFLKELRLNMQYLGISDVNMEEGSMRCDVNVSLKKKGEDKLGTRCEVKNLNSFRNVQKAIDYETMRQADLLDSGKEVDQETRLFDVPSSKTFTLRSKEDAHDYRYFTCPDLTIVTMAADQLKNIKESMSELPDQVRERFSASYGLSDYDIEVMIADKSVINFYDETAKIYKNHSAISNWVTSHLLREVKDRGCDIYDVGISPAQLGELIHLIDNGVISGKIAKELLPEICDSEMGPKELVEQKGLMQISNSTELETVVERVLQNNPDEVVRFRDGEKKLKSFFMGQIMKETKGKANPKKVDELLTTILDN